MLARPDAYRCIECGLPYRAAGFWHHRGKIEDGAAYWSDRGILCSPQCSLAHHRKRQAEGTLPQAPAADPFVPAALPPLMASKATTGRIAAFAAGRRKHFLNHGGSGSDFDQQGSAV